MENSKVWYLSKGIWGGILSGLVGALALLGVAVDANFVNVVSDKIVLVIPAAITVVGAILAIVGRIKAVKKIGK